MNEMLEHIIKTFCKEKENLIAFCKEKARPDEEANDVKLQLVLHPYISCRKNQINEIIKKIKDTGGKSVVNISCIIGIEYAKAVVDNPDSGLNDEIGWTLLGEKGYCGYKEKVVYIGYPFLFGYGADLPLERAIKHEVGHYKQQIIDKIDFNDNSMPNQIIREYHNIMMNENQSDVKLTGGSWSYEGKRIKYGKKEWNEKINFNIIDFLRNDSGKKEEDIVNDTINKIKEIVKNTKEKECTAVIDENKKVISEMIDKVRNDMNDMSKDDISKVDMSEDEMSKTGMSETDKLKVYNLKADRSLFINMMTALARNEME